MTKKFFSILLCALLLLTGCSGNVEESIIEMELTNNYATSDPFVNDKLFYVSDSINTLESNEKEKEYVIRFTGTEIKYAKIVVTSDDKLVKEREKPMKPNKE